eukprot:4390149-Amphidinium_carterae.1
MELWYGSDRVPDDDHVEDWPGVQPRGEISEYQVVLTHDECWGGSAATLYEKGGQREPRETELPQLRQ